MPKITAPTVKSKQMTKAERHLRRYLHSIAASAVKKFNLKLHRFGIITGKDTTKEHLYGLCYPFKKDIFIRLLDPKKCTYYPIEFLIDTTLHEVAHLKYVRDCHSPRFWKFYDKLLKWYYSE